MERTAIRGGIAVSSRLLDRDKTVIGEIWSLVPKQQQTWGL